MKRRQYLFLIITGMICLFHLTGCGSQKQEDDPVVGIWRAIEIRDDAKKTDPNELGLSFTMDVRPDGIYRADFAGEQEEGTWKKEKETYTFTSSREELIFQYKEDTLTVTIQPLVITFQKQK